MQKELTVTQEDCLQIKDRDCKPNTPSNHIQPTYTFYCWETETGIS